MKRMREKTIMAAIILSCGFVMRSEPPPKPAKSKNTTEARTKRMAEVAEASLSVHAERELTRRSERPAW